MSFFSGKPFAGSAYGAPPQAAANPQAEVSRLLNSYSNHWCSLDKAIQEARAQQAQEQQAYHQAVQELHGAKEQLMRSEEALARAEAECHHEQQDVEAKQGKNNKVKLEVNNLKAEEGQLQLLRDQARTAFLQECQDLTSQLRALKQANPKAFFKPCSES